MEYLKTLSQNTRVEPGKNHGNLLNTSIENYRYVVLNVSVAVVTN
jgi:hypothetical protein